jgi:hypothetical protein
VNNPRLVSERLYVAAEHMEDEDGYGPTGVEEAAFTELAIS